MWHHKQILGFVQPYSHHHEPTLRDNLLQSLESIQALFNVICGARCLLFRTGATDGSTEPNLQRSWCVTGNCVVTFPVLTSIARVKSDCETPRNSAMWGSANQSRTCPPHPELLKTPGSAWFCCAERNLKRSELHSPSLRHDIRSIPWNTLRLRTSRFYGILFQIFKIRRGFVPPNFQFLSTSILSS